MTVAVKLTVNQQDLKALQTKMEQRLPEDIERSVFGFAQHVVKKMKANALNDPLRPITKDRQRASALIHAKRQSNNRSVIKMPRSLMFLDSMKPHYVSLKRGRKITKWANKHYPSATVGGKSRTWYGPKGGLKGALYVTPHPFVTKSLSESRNILPNQLRKGINKAFKGTAA